MLTDESKTDAKSILLILQDIAGSDQKNEAAGTGGGAFRRRFVV
jgi:hypothetical protein